MAPIVRKFKRTGNVCPAARFAAVAHRELGNKPNTGDGAEGSPGPGVAAGGGIHRFGSMARPSGFGTVDFATHLKLTVRYSASVFVSSWT